MVNHGALSEELLNQAFADCWRHPFDWVANEYGFSKEMLTVGWKVFTSTEVTEPMYGYGDLAILSQLSAMRFLVTTGFRRLQQSKISALGLEQLFTANFIDAIDEPGRHGKRGLFERILRDYRLTPSEVLVVGDNAHSEIEVGNGLGMRTVQTLRPGVPRASNAMFHINSLADLKNILDVTEKTEA